MQSPPDFGQLYLKNSLFPLEGSNFQPIFICGHFIYPSVLLPALAFG